MVQYAESTIDQILESISLYDFAKTLIELAPKGKDYFGICPFHQEQTGSFSISPETNNFYCFGCGEGGSIINFVMLYKKMSFPNAVGYLLNYANIDTSTAKLESETFQLFKKLAKLIEPKISKGQHTILLPDTMDQYEFSGLDLWKKEGISDATLTKYQVRFDRSAGRIVYPIHDCHGNLINVKGRIVSSNWQERQARKYTYYYPMIQSDFLFGLYQNQKCIQDKGEVIVFESAKSVMKLESWGICNCVSIETSHFTDEQIKLLLSLHGNVIIGLDKDVPIPTIKKDLKLLCKLTNVYVIKDNHDLLGQKDAPCDKGLDVWNRLYKEKFRL